LDDFTVRERRVDWWIKNEAEKIRREGKKVRVARTVRSYVRRSVLHKEIKLCVKLKCTLFCNKILNEKR